MKHVLCSLASAGLALVCPFVLQGQSTLTTQPRNPGPPLEYSDQEQILNYWTAEGGWHSELQLRNNLPDQSLTVTPVLRGPDGAESKLSAVVILPQEVRTINVSQAIDEYAPQLAGLYGSVILRYHAAAYRNLYAAIMVHDTGHPIAFHIDASGESTVYDAGSREGIWWLPSETTKDILVLTNQGNEHLEIDLSVYDARGKEAHRLLNVGPHQTNRYSIREFVRDGGLTGEYGGIHVQPLAHGGSLDSLHAIYDEVAGFSALLKMFDRDPKASLEQRDFNRTSKWTLRAPMLALANPDAVLGFPADVVLEPQLFIHNVSTVKTTVTLQFNWRSDTSTGNISSPTLILDPHETRRVDVANLQGTLGIPKDAHWAAVILTTDSHPDDLVAVSASFDKTLRYGAQTPFSDQLSHIWKGGQWEYDSTHDSIITAGNGGTKTIDAAFTIFYNQGQQKYELEQKLAPNEQMWIDVGKLVHDQVPDKNGKSLPADLRAGSYEFRDLTNVNIGQLFEGKVIYDKSYGHVAYGCAACCATTSVYLTYDPFYNPIGPGFTNGVYSRDDCQDPPDDVSSDFYNWSTANHAVATTTIYGVHTGVSVGNTTSSTNGYVVRTNGRNGCYEALAGPSGPTDVAATPTNFRVTASRDAGYGDLNVTLAWNSTTGDTDDLSNCQIGETVTYPGANPYIWPKPPFPTESTPNPTTGSFSATKGYGIDDHDIPGDPPFVKPYSASSFLATQTYWYTCSNYQGGAHVTLMGPLTITRAVASNGSGGWKFTASETGITTTATINPLP